MNLIVRILCMVRDQDGLSLMNCEPHLVCVQDPLFVPQILKHVGPVAFFDWCVHFVGLGWYTLLNSIAPPLRVVAKRLPGRQSFALHRQLDSWKYGSGQDYTL